MSGAHSSSPASALRQPSASRSISALLRGSTGKSDISLSWYAHFICGTRSVVPQDEACACQSHQRPLPLPGFCASADAAAVFSRFVDLGSARTFPAALAALLDVVLLFAIICSF